MGRKKPLPKILRKLLTASFSEAERREVEVIFWDQPNTYYEASPEEQAETDEVDRDYERYLAEAPLRAAGEKARNEAEAQRPDVREVRFMFEGRRYKMEWISKWDPRNRSHLSPFKQTAERIGYWEGPKLEQEGDG